MDRVQLGRIINEPFASPTAGWAEADEAVSEAHATRAAYEKAEPHRESELEGGTQALIDILDSKRKALRDRADPVVARATKASAWRPRRRRLIPLRWSNAVTRRVRIPSALVARWLRVNRRRIVIGLGVTLAGGSMLALIVLLIFVLGR